MQLNIVIRYKGEVAEFLIEDIKGEWQLKKMFKLVLGLYKRVNNREACDLIKQAEDILKKGGNNGNN